MSTNLNLNISPHFKRADPAMMGCHPLRGLLGEKIEWERQLRSDEEYLKHEKGSKLRDTIISALGLISALIPIVIAIKSVVGV